MSGINPTTDDLKAEHDELLKKFYKADNKNKYLIRRRLREITRVLMFSRKAERKNDIGSV